MIGTRSVCWSWRKKNQGRFQHRNIPSKSKACISAVNASMSVLRMLSSHKKKPQTISEWLLKHYIVILRFRRSLTKYDIHALAYSL